MARSRPRTKEAFAKIHGVGAAKLEDLAEPFLKVIGEAGS
jgi:superfamily II DNA helicase RecQ